MKRFSLFSAVIFLFLLADWTFHQDRSVVADIADERATAQTAMKNGNFKDAYDLFRTICLSEEADGAMVARDYVNAVTCLNQLGRLTEFDDLSEQTVAAHDDDWQVLRSVADQMLTVQHWGFRVAGEFQRGQRRGGGVVVNSMERDRLRALQLYVQAMPLVAAEQNKQAAASFYLGLSSALLNGRGYQESWRLQYLSDIAELPDYSDGYPQYRAGLGAPVDEEGNPVYHQRVRQWQEAETDGQRWRWALDQVVENNPGQRNAMLWQFAQFCQQQFGVQTMQESAGPFRGGMGFGRPGAEAHSVDEPKEGGPYQLHKLSDSETIARLASGIKRFELPDEFNHIQIYKQLAGSPQGSYRRSAADQLGSILENRRQFPRAAAHWREVIKEYRPAPDDHAHHQLQQIVGDWGAIETVQSQAAGQAVEFGFRFRNARKVSFTAHQVHVDKLLGDVKQYLLSHPSQFDWEKIQIQNLGWKMIQNNQPQYIGEQVAQWSVDLEPRQNHFDRRVMIETPLDEGGAYLITSKTGSGNETKVVLWVDNTSIVRKQLSGGSYYFFADARTGDPVAGLDVEFFGYRQERKKNIFELKTSLFKEKTDAHGQVFPNAQQLSENYNWLVVARNDKGRLAHLGFSGVWSGRYHDEQYNLTRIFCITDRPVYRPEQKVQFKAWLRKAQYDKEDVSQFAGKSVNVEIFNPKNERVYQQQLTADEYGGVSGELELPGDATLGMYQVGFQAMSIRGGSSFRVEEYKKPEFEVTIDAPTEPVMLGEVVTAQVNARYYFGSPVTEATVKIKVLRTRHEQNWFPIAPWDWCFGNGYWWFSYDYPWYPGYQNWVGCMRPSPWWWPMQQDPPEVVMELETDILPDGTVKVEIDTALAQALHGNSDHKYEITAEVRDQSRRTIVGQSSILVAQQPFKVFSWVDRGYYQVGQTIKAHFQAQTLDQKPVQGEGVLKLLRISYDRRNEPVETVIRKWDLETGADGEAEQQIAASAPGQYRLSLELTDSEGHTIEGGYIFTIVGEGFDGRKFRFNDLELIPDKQEYQPGETVNLQINTNRPDSTVLLFVRPANGVYLKPLVVQMNGKSTIEKITISKKDMPNFFVEAVTVSNGQVHQQAKEIIVPPEKRVLNLEVIPSAAEYKPGEEATVRVHMTDIHGENFVGSTVISVYDKSVEYISGGSNVPDIKEFFWKWRRDHHPSHETNLLHYEQVLSSGDLTMMPIGIFGATVAEDMDLLSRGRDDRMKTAAQFSGGMGGNRAFGGGAPGGVEMMMDSAMAEGADMEMGGGMGGMLTAKAEAAPGSLPGLAEATVRTNFADTAFWAGSITTDATGIAEVTFPMPENLTTWKINAWGMGHGTNVGEGHAEVMTRKNVILRLQAPRFFTQKDEVVLSANVHNYLATDKDVRVSLELDGDELLSLDPLTVTVRVPADGESRVDWRVKVEREGMTTVRMLALTDEESDAMEMTFPCHVHGILKTESWAGTIRPDGQQASVSINVPQQRQIEQSMLEIRYSPSLAAAMVDALPYLAEYPYGCTEQTLNRFLPSVITQKILLEMNLNLAQIQQKRTNLNAQEIGDDRERVAGWKRFDRNPVFDEDELDRMVREGLKRLTSMQNNDGGWGWFSGPRQYSYPHTTCVVVHGLQIARQNDVAVAPEVLDRGLAWLNKYQAQEVQKLQNAPGKKKPWKNQAGNLDAMVYMVLVDAGQDNTEMRDFLYHDRIQLAVYSKAMFALALETQGQQEMLDMLVQNIEQFLIQDAENETAYLKLPEGSYWWYWYGSEIEANAYYLKLLARVKPQSVQASRLVKYLLNNRKHATYWKSTRDTAICVEAFGEYLKATGETRPNMVVEVWLDGEKKQEVAINEENLFSFDNKFVLAGEELASGAHEIELRRRGEGPVYFNAYLTNFTLEDHITAAGLEVKVDRKYYKLVPVDQEIPVPGSRGQAASQKVEKYERVPIENLGLVTSGDLVEIELEIESKNDYEYVLFEDRKAAGFEPVDVRSGYDRSGLGAYREMRDDRVSFFLRQLPRGRHSVSYRVRAEIPGKFSALPTIAYAMYAPELKGNSDEIKIRIADQE